MLWNLHKRILDFFTNEGNSWENVTEQRELPVQPKSRLSVMIVRLSQWLRVIATMVGKNRLLVESAPVSYDREPGVNQKSF
jgi:hypothetical protein